VRVYRVRMAYVNVRSVRERRPKKTVAQILCSDRRRRFAVLEHKTFGTDALRTYRQIKRFIDFVAIKRDGAPICPETVARGRKSEPRPRVRRPSSDRNDTFRRTNSRVRRPRTSSSSSPKNVTDIRFLVVDGRPTVSIHRRRKKFERKDRIKNLERYYRTDTPEITTEDVSRNEKARNEKQTVK